MLLRLALAKSAWPAGTDIAQFLGARRPLDIVLLAWCSAGAPNLAKRLIDAVRRRKGLPVEEKVVESATKQRTRARKV